MKTVTIVIIISNFKSCCIYVTAYLYLLHAPLHCCNLICQDCLYTTKKIPQDNHATHLYEQLVTNYTESLYLLLYHGGDTVLVERCQHTVAAAREGLDE